MAQHEVEAVGVEQVILVPLLEGGEDIHLHEGKSFIHPLLLCLGGFESVGLGIRVLHEVEEDKEAGEMINNIIQLS